MSSFSQDSKTPATLQGWFGSLYSLSLFSCTSAPQACKQTDGSQILDLQIYISPNNKLTKSGVYQFTATQQSTELSIATQPSEEM
mmetsp:Transcript_37344/g.60739  ORF Transcript_37344/g.60739 Transcript_37344/m.60739 type:complete len:85 (+) Transcript_37344:1798-2052(+)